MKYFATIFTLLVIVFMNTKDIAYTYSTGAPAAKLVLRETKEVLVIRHTVILAQQLDRAKTSLYLYYNL